MYVIEFARYKEIARNRYMPIVLHI